MAEKSSGLPRENYLEIVEKMIKEIQYGQITIVVQDGKVVQIEKNEKIRMKN